ncbi:MAG: hypothetical protein LBE38_02795 [Deltaproteobacteria bacterium]|jgi:hypothetical protein|nr:hypothetical protein [Deltaproteobacteria bacterium]
MAKIEAKNTLGEKLLHAAYLLAVPILAISFAWAAVLKIIDIQGTLVTINAYRIVPLFFAPFIALLLPFVELTMAVFLISGPQIYRKTAAFILGALLIIFMLAALQGLVRDLDFSCGCFGFGKEAERPDIFFFLRDLALTALAGIILLSSKTWPTLRA